MKKRGRQDRSPDLYRAILTLNTTEEAISFFDDLCTITELQAMEQRFQVVELLDQGLVYNDILERTGASSATISRVNRCLQYGEGGYTTALARLRQADEDTSS